MQLSSIPRLAAAAESATSSGRRAALASRRSLLLPTVNYSRRRSLLSSVGGPRAAASVHTTATPIRLGEREIMKGEKVDPLVQAQIDKYSHMQPTAISMQVGVHCSHYFYVQYTSILIKCDIISIYIFSSRTFASSAALRTASPRSSFSVVSSL